MYFVHPQIKFNLKNLFNLFFCFLKKPARKDMEKIKEMFPGKDIFFTDMGRTAFRLIIKQLDLQNSKMLVPAYLCDIFYPVFKEYNIRPVFLDIDKETFNIEAEQIRRVLESEKGIKSILLVHIYGKRADLEKIIALAKIHGLIVIEDCAHASGNNLKGKCLGNFGRAAFFSLYKFFPTLRGGLAVLPANNLNISLPKTKFSMRDFISLLNCFPFFAFLFKKYASQIAPKYLRKEKKQELTAINRVSLNILFWQMRNSRETFAKRKELALFFQKELARIGFTMQNAENNSFNFLSVLAPENINRDQLVRILRKKGIFATRIWHSPIILNSDVQKEYNLNLSQFPNTIDAAKRIINFPLQNFYRKKDILKMSEKISLILKELAT